MVIIKIPFCNEMVFKLQLNRLISADS